MKHSVILLTLLVASLAFSACVGTVFCQTIWVFGKVTAFPEEVTYESVEYYQFNFSVTNDSRLSQTYPYELTVVAPFTVMAQIVLNQDVELNLTGSIVNDQPTNESIPVGYFLVERVNTEDGEVDWIQAIKDFWALISQIGKGLVTVILAIVQAFTGVQLPSWGVSLAVVAFSAFMFLRMGKKLPWLIMIIMFFIVAAVISNLIVTLVL